MDYPLGNPYGAFPSESFWKTAIAEASLGSFDPITRVPFRISKRDRVATAGSCFAQHISRALIAEGVRFLQTEKAAPADAARLPVYSARYGNIYTARQLRQLFQRAYGLFAPSHSAWKRADGRYVDCFRPNEFPAGFATIEDVERAGLSHLAAVREVFEECDVFVFTLGLTEAWLGDDDGAAVPLPPGVVAEPVDGTQPFSAANLSVQDLSDDLLVFIDDMRLVNPAVRFVISVSPVPIIATFEDRHVIASNAYTKAVLRVVAQAAANQRRDVLYFPSYEMIVTHPKARYFDDNCRAVKPEGVEAVMRIFRRRILEGEAAPKPKADLDQKSGFEGDLEIPDLRDVKTPLFLDPTILESEFKGVICDEEMIGR